MTAQDKTTIKSYFLTGGDISQSDMIDLVDSYQDSDPQLDVFATKDVSTDTTFASASDGVISTQKAVKTYVDTEVATATDELVKVSFNDTTPEYLEDKIPEATVIDEGGNERLRIMPVGAVIQGFYTTPPNGYLLLNGDTIGDVGSGADIESADNENLFKKLWDNMPDIVLPRVEEDAFAGTVINAGKWVETDSSNCITQNNELIVQPNAGTTGSRFALGSNLVSVKSVTSGIATVSANFDFNLASHNFMMLRVRSGIGDYASIVNQYDGTGIFYLETASGSSLGYNFNSGIVGLNQNRKVKITYDITSKDIKFWYWGGSAWIQMGTTQNVDIGTTMKVEVFGYYAGGSLSWVGKIDNLYFTDDDYQGEIPEQNFVLPSRGASADADWTAGKEFIMPDARNKVFYGADTNLGQVSNAIRTGGDIQTLKVNNIIKL